MAALVMVASEDPAARVGVCGQPPEVFVRAAQAAGLVMDGQTPRGSLLGAQNRQDVPLQAPCRR